MGVTGGIAFAVLFRFGVDGPATSSVRESTESSVAVFLFRLVFATLAIEGDGACVIAEETALRRADLRRDILSTFATFGEYERMKHLFLTVKFCSDLEAQSPSFQKDAVLCLATVKVFEVNLQLQENRKRLRTVYFLFMSDRGYQCQDERSEMSESFIRAH